MEKFDYSKAIAELERLAALAEDPDTGLDKLDENIKRSQELIEQCREYLRTARTKVEQLGK
ncbi:MAG: exodeoxyribonuclease VII small subunit [Bacteroidales bacterium]|nr:exodeoxyribonuclease VII small subunit [Bacteroidales bacterium]